MRHQFRRGAADPVKLEAFIQSSFENAGPKSAWIDEMEGVRVELAHFLNADPSEIAFTKNTSEAMNIAANALPLNAGDEVLMLEGDDHVRQGGVN
ncbi:MAG: aminotransferase class V-fold PLP-dependent enzyme [Paracoccus hibiscisoli]|uniref:aminotransferase class V-fold PLP-dependent enzyme n=1 Tax=Paracoccus hibiscisoli TaxID=2023261 RepID=UPI003918D9E2